MGQIEILAGREIKMKSQRREGVGGDICVWVGRGGGVYECTKIDRTSERKTGRQGKGCVGRRVRMQDDRKDDTEMGEGYVWGLGSDNARIQTGG